VTDRFLAYLLDLFIEHEFSVDVTLLTNGMLVSGEPIGEEEYFGLVAQLFESGFQEVGGDQEAAARMHAFMSGVGKRRQEAARTRARRRREQGRAAEVLGPASEDSAVGQRHSIHLKDVAIAGGGLAQVVEMPFWRGQLTQIAGWSFGRLEQAGDGELEGIAPSELG
jgi:hypothetical protein